MTEAEAIAAAERQRSFVPVPAPYQVRTAQRRWIELLDEASGVRWVRDCLVWVVRFAAGIAWIEVAIDSTGAIVRVQRSRGAMEGLR